MATAVHVKNISGSTTEKEVRDFFSFCGKISTLVLTPDEKDTQTAIVTFEKETAAKTALLLDNTQLGTSSVQVTSAQPSDATAATTASESAKEHDDITQDDKPRSRIIAEYLAHGYVISDKAIETALNMDKKNGYSSKFQNALKQFDEKNKVTERSKSVDEKYNVSGRTWSAWLGLSSFFEKALGTPTGQKVRAFYEQGEKQVLDVHNEARHLADLKKQQGKPAEATEQSQPEASTTQAADVETEKKTEAV